MNVKMTDAAILSRGRSVVKAEAAAVAGLKRAIGRSFVEAVRLAAAAPRVAVVGVGKSGLIGRKIAATLASTGTPSVFLHPVECLHGDIGMLSKGDLILALSHSGETEETNKLLPYLRRQGFRIVSFTGNVSSRLAKCSHIAIDLGVRSEACPYNIVPTSSTAAMLALGDALAITLMELKGFTSSNFARLHPGGSLGRLLNLSVGDIMRKGRGNPVIEAGAPLSRALKVMTSTKLGAVSAVDGKGRLAGFFTDGDLRRCLQSGVITLSTPLSAVMTRSPLRIGPEAPAMEAAAMITSRKIDNLPVVDSRGRPVGIVDERDLLKEGLL
ncbi:MAG: arabinose-5-phosphate isomerase [Elusimicrobia bacterium]|nr:MAG: arabinose-5-phosphate isomerase [Elusimicrobiota bacterium]KAF0156590.1 MAG: arabinose-5-phosphate isomerase [Elusimicrobiota bacterium]